METNKGKWHRRADIPDLHLRSFHGAVKRTLPPLPRGTALYRFIWYAEEVDPSQRPPSPFWLPQESFREIVRLHQETNVPIDEVVREVAALAFDFKEIVSGVMSVRLKAITYGYIGTTARQRLVTKKARTPQTMSRALHGVGASGGLMQLYLPNLWWDDFYDVKIERLYRSGSNRLLFSQR